MKRILLFLFTNIAIVLVLSIAFHVICSFLGLDMHELNQDGINYSTIAVFSLVFGMGGAFISLLLSKPIAKFVTGATVVDGTENESTRWLVDTIRQLAERANISMPEVAIYPGPANAFATGAFKDSALVAVSEDIMGQMTKEELRAVLGHEISHIANGDMVTMTLLQGVLNAFVLFLSRVIAFMVSRSSDNRRGSSMVFYLVYYTLQISLGILASIVLCAYSRRREYAADAGSASLLGSPSLMIAALRRLGNLEPGVLPDSLKAMGISSKGKAVSLFSTHPDIEDRINALENLTR